MGFSTSFSAPTRACFSLIPILPAASLVVASLLLQTIFLLELMVPTAVFLMASLLLQTIFFLELLFPAALNLMASVLLQDYIFLPTILLTTALPLPASLSVISLALADHCYHEMLCPMALWSRILVQETLPDHITLLIMLALLFSWRLFRFRLLKSMLDRLAGSSALLSRAAASSMCQRGSLVCCIGPAGATPSGSTSGRSACA